MCEKKLSDSKLSKVVGGQAVLPLLSNTAEDTELGVVNRIKMCQSCGATIKCPSTGKGTVTCEACGTVNRY